jgi:hypothetical protein
MRQSLILQPHTLYIAVTTCSGRVFVLGALFGGVGAGFLWVCQGAYFSNSAAAFSSLSGNPGEKAAGKFASIFATIYLALEVSFKVAASGIKQAIPGQRGSEVMYLIFMVVGGVLSCVGMSRIDDLQDGLDSETQEGDTSQVGGTTRRERSASASGASSATATAAPRGTAAGVSAKLVYSKAAGAMRLLWHNKKMALMLPTQFSFSVVASFLGSWITPNVLTKVVGNEKIGLFLGEWARSVASVLSEWARSVASVLSAVSGLVV